MRHYTAIKSLNRLLSRSNSTHHGKQYFCSNCLQNFMLESSRDEYQVYCENNEAVRVEMPQRDRPLNFVIGRTNFRSHL